MSKPSKRPGRPCLIPSEEIDSIIESFAADIFVDGNVVSKKNEIWKLMSEKTEGRKNPSGFYSYFVDNRNDIKSRVRKLVDAGHISSFASSSASVSNDSTVISAGDKTDLSIFKNSKLVQINFTQREFVDLLEQKQYKRTEKERPNLCDRQYTNFIPGHWQLVVSEKLWAKNIKHGFHFKTHKISWYSNTAYFKGYCKCGSEIVGNFEDISCDNIVVQCTISAGDGTGCGKRYCREPERKDIGKKLVEQKIGAYAYRAERANEIMNEGDPEPGHLYSADVYRKIKSQQKKNTRRHAEVVSSLEILQLTDLKDVIHSIGLNPFYVHYWTHHQLDVYRNYCRIENSRICIDATGSVVRKIERLDKSKSRAIFLYQCVVHDGKEQYSVNQMLTESHDTNSINYWLVEWLRSGAPYPKEVVSDCSQALLTASVRAFTGYLTVNEYADACTETSVPTCYIRLDVAHIIKGYSDFLSATRIRIKRFYLGAIGLIILSTNKDEAKKLLIWLLTVCRSETEGQTENGPTLCHLRKRKLQELLTRSRNDIMDETITSILELNPEGGNEKADEQNKEKNGKEDDDSTNDKSKMNSWQTWGLAIDKDVKESIENEIGDVDNAHFLPSLADRLMRDMRLFPLWSCVCRNTFGYGRQPASSAPAEADFKRLKRDVFGDRELPERVDDFVVKHVKNLSGSIKIIDAANANVECEVSEETSTDGDNMYANKSTAQDKIDDSSELNGAIPIANSTCDAEHANNLLADAETDGRLENYEKGIGNTSADERTLKNKKEKRNLPTVTKVETIGKENCIACAMHHLPAGAHKCIFCKKPVHVFPSCSKQVEGEEEGYGEKRVCVSCFRDFPDSVIRNMTTNAKENWENLATSPPKRVASNTKTILKRCIEPKCSDPEAKIPKLVPTGVQSKKRSRYLNPNFFDHELVLHEKLSTVPILRNGNQMGLKPISLDGRKMTLSNTCAFDSVFQLFLASALDSTEFSEVCEKTSNDLLKMVHKVSKNGVKADSYLARAKILSNICKISSSHCGVDLVDSQLTVGGLCQEIFKDIPSLTEIVRCSEGCPERRVVLPRIQIDRKLASDKTSLVKAIEDGMALNNRGCANQGCRSTTPPNVIVEPGSFLIIELSSNTAEDNDHRQRLQDIPVNLELSFSKKEYHLAGVVQFNSPILTRRNSDTKAIGHYFAISHRRDHSWIAYDDNKDRAKPLMPKYQACYQIFIYIR